MTQHAEALAIFTEFGIEVVPGNVMPSVGQVRAVGTLQGILNRYGVDHARMIVMTFAETQNNKIAMDKYTLWAMSDLIRAADSKFPQLMKSNMELWFRFFDGVPFGWIQDWAHDLDGIASKRGAMVGMIWERMERVFGPMRLQPDLFDDRGAA